MRKVLNGYLLKSRHLEKVLNFLWKHNMQRFVILQQDDDRDLTIYHFSVGAMLYFCFAKMVLFICVLFILL